MALAFLRRHRRWFFVFLWVVILAFVILYIPNLDPTNRLAEASVATVGGRPITASAFQRQYLRMRRQYLSMNQGMDEAMLERMGLKEQVLSSMVRDEIEGLEAARLGIQIDDVAVTKAITEDPQLQIDGRFVGGERLKSFLQQQGMTLKDFEDDVRRTLRAQRLREIVTDGVEASDADIENEFRRRTELVHAEYVFLDLARFESSIQPTDDQIRAHFEANKERFRLPERRKLSYLQIDPADLRAKASPTGTEVSNYYNENSAQFENPEQACGQHILVKVKKDASAKEGHEDAEAKRLAEDILARLKKGEAFEKVAKEKSEDEGSAKSGGNLGCFPRGQMVREFEDAAFALKDGTISDLVKSPFGYHIIKIDTKIAASKTPLEQARKQIEAQLQAAKARELASQKAASVAAAIQSGQTLEQVATAQALTVKKSPPLQLGKGADVLTNPNLLSSAFELKAGETGKEGFPAGSGVAFFRVDEILPAKVPELGEVKDDVRKDLLERTARDEARAALKALAENAGRVGLDKAATQAKATRSETKGLIGHGQPFPGIPSSSVFEERVFASPEKTFTDPIDLPNGVALARVIERKDIDKDALAQQREAIRTAVISARKDQFFGSYLQTLKDRFPINENAEALAGIR